MMNLNNTISAFRCCTQVPPTCSKCPLTEMCKWSMSRDKCKTEVKLSVNHWLKAQEPHIVTIADYENNTIVDKDGNLAVWRESRHLNGIAYHNDGWVILNRDRVEGWFNSEMVRFWTSRPTDEQREATPWN